MSEKSRPPAPSPHPSMPAAMEAAVSPVTRLDAGSDLGRKMGLGAIEGGWRSTVSDLTWMGEKEEGREYARERTREGVRGRKKEENAPVTGVRKRG